MNEYNFLVLRFFSWTRGKSRLIFLKREKTTQKYKIQVDRDHDEHQNLKNYKNLRHSTYASIVRICLLLGPKLFLQINRLHQLISQN